MKHMMKSILVGSLFSGVAIAQTPSSGDVTINNFEYSGTGCPDGSVAANVSPDNKAMSLLFDNYVVDSTETPSYIARKDCRIKIKLNTPAGWKYALYGIDFRGYADLTEGAIATQSSSVRFGSSSFVELGKITMTGPVSIDYQSRVEKPLSTVAWSNCGNGGGENTLTIDSSAIIDTTPVAKTRDFHLASGSYRYNQIDLGKKITRLDVVKKYSTAACKLNSSYGFKGTVAWVNSGCRADFKATFAIEQPEFAPSGLLTIDSIDGEVNQHYGIAWSRCSEGSWIQSDGNKTCTQVCSAKKMVSARDADGAQCASGEARPASALSSISFVKGCWPNCASQGAIKTDAVGVMCYRPGQKRDNDKTDRIVGCFCK